MPLLPYTYVKVSDRLRVKVSNHFFYSDFGVRGGADGRMYGHRYICSGTPGTGFIERETDSHSYHEFVRTHPAVRPQRYKDLLLGHEPNYDRELAKAEAALRDASDSKCRQILECYTNALAIGRVVEQMQRIEEGLKRKMGSSQNRYIASVIGRYKRKIAQLGQDMKNVEYHLEQHYPPEIMAAYSEMCDAFNAMIHRCRRIWHHNSNNRNRFETVFFDMGIFDFIRYEKYIPLMRNSLGVSYYILPDSLLVARSSVDFYLVPLRSVTLVWQEMAIEEPTELLSSHLVDAACMIQMPTLDTAFYFNHAHVVVDFIHSVDKLKSLLPS